MHIRNSGKAVICIEGKLLLTRNRDEEGTFYLFPGGGQEHSESLKATVKRECLEELGAVVDVGDLLHVREYIGKNHEHSAYDATIHQVEYYFSAKLTTEEKDFLVPAYPDSHQTGYEWIPVEELDQVRLYPKAIIASMEDLVNRRKSLVYLGDVN